MFFMLLLGNPLLCNLYAVHCHFHHIDKAFKVDLALGFIIDIFMLNLTKTPPEYP